jgi:hypothetical protein
MKKKENFNISISFISKNNSNKLTLNQIEFEGGIKVQIISYCLTQRLIFGLKNIKKYNMKIGFSFSRKFDIELSLNGSKVVLSESRDGEFITIAIPEPKDEKSVFEAKLTKLEKILSCSFNSLLKSLNSHLIDYQIPKEGFEVMLLKGQNKTKLSDYEIYLLLRGLKEPQAREIASNFENNGYSFSENTKHLSEKYILKLEEKYGINFLKNLLEIPEKPFGLNTVSRLR